MNSDGIDKIKNSDDVSLVALAKGGDNEALSELLNRYSDKVSGKAASYKSIVGLDCDDLYQEGMLGLLSAVYDFDVNRGASFETYASVVVNRKMLSALRSANSKKNFPLREYVPIEEKRDLRSHIPTPEESLLKNEELSSINDFIEGSLSKTEKKVLKLAFLGLSYGEIAEILDLNEKSVDNALQRVRTKFRNLR